MALSLLLLPLALAGCGADEDDAEANADGKLLILEWSGYEATEYPQFYAPFTEKYADNLDEVVEYSFFADDAEALAKMQSDIGADLVHPCNSWWQLYVDNGLVQPIDTSRLSNWDKVQNDLAAMGQFNGEQYFVPWEWGYESMLVRTDLVEEVPDAWIDLWDPQYAGHVAIWDSAETNYVMTALALGFDPWGTTPEQEAEIEQKLIELKPNLLTYWSDYTEAYDLPASGDAWIIAGAWQDAYAYLESDGYEVAYVQPEEGRLGWVCGFGLSANSGDLDLAYEFLDAAIADESMAALANEYWYGPANTTSLPLIDEYVVDFMDLDEVDTLTERTVLYQPLTEEQRIARTTLWDTVKASP
ncbi:MAG: extracellular solute-binding protein [Ardenticatenaceae bacterium]|nr:extracellular solute-binding protein [Ardenticatenaceae bacterium]